jgi:hypothetical protein
MRDSKAFVEAANEAIRCPIEKDPTTGEQSRKLKVGDRVGWGDDKGDQGTITETNWAGLTIKWDNRDKQDVLHNDMAQMEQMPLRG